MSDEISKSGAVGTTTIRVLNTLPLGPDDRQRLDEVSPRLEIVHRPIAADEWSDLHDEDVEVIIGGRLPGRPDLTPSLRWLQIPSGGSEYIHIPPGGLEAWPNAVTVTNGRGAYSFAIAEYVLWALLDHYQRGANRRALQAARTWPRLEDEEPALGRRLRGQTLLLVGYGSVGRQVAFFGRQLGMRVLAIKARPDQRESDAFTPPGSGDPNGVIPERIGGLGDLDRFAAEADAVVVTLPGTPATKAAVSESVLEALPSHALVVVAGRGSTVDYDALRRAITDGHIEHAAIDTFPSEPLAPGDSTWTISGLTITPHIAGGVSGDPIFHDLPVFVDLVVDNLSRYVSGLALRNRMDLARGY